MGHFFQVSLGQSSLLCWLLSPYWVYLKIFLFVCVHLSQDGFQQRGLWVGWYHLLWGGAPSLFDLQGTFLRLCSWEGLLDLENEKYVSSVFYVGRAQLLLPPAVLEYLSTGNDLQLISLRSRYLLSHYNCLRMKRQIWNKKILSHTSKYSIILLDYFWVTVLLLI